jgi:hypothetical protein
MFVALGAMACQSPLGEHSSLQIMTPTAPTVAVVYNDTDSTDVASANSLKTLLSTDLRSNSGVGGTETIYHVNLVPQSSIPTVFTSSYLIAGNPIILTPGLTIGAYSASTATTVQLAQEQNIANQNVTMIAVGGQGAVSLFDDITANASSWMRAGQQSPSSIGWGPSLDGTDTTVNLVAHSGLNLLAAPYSAPNPTATSVVVNSSAQSDVAALAPAKGLALGQSSSASSYYSIVQVGRFLQYGFAAVPDTVAGKVLFVNLVAFMANIPASAY